MAARRTGPDGGLAEPGRRTLTASARPIGAGTASSTVTARTRAPRVPASDRDSFRDTGRHLVDALVRHLDETGQARALAERDAIDLAAHLGERLALHGVPLADAVSMFVSARRPFLAELGVVARRRGVDGARVGDLFDSSTWLLDRLLLAFVAGHEVVSTARRRDASRRTPRPRDGTAPAPPRAEQHPMTALRDVFSRPRGVLAAVFTLMLVDQWLDRRHGFQLAWAIGMLCFTVGSGAEALAGRQRLERAALPRLVPRRRHLHGGLARARDGVPARPDAVRLHVRGDAPAVRAHRADDPEQPHLRGRRAAAGAVPARRRRSSPSPSSWPPTSPATRWPRFAAVAIGGTTLLAIVLTVAMPPLPAPGYALSPATGQPVGDAMPGYLRLLTPLMNIPGAMSLLLGAVFSAYVFMPKRRVLPYSLDPTQPGDQFLFNLLHRPVAIPVNFVGLAARRGAGAVRRPAPLAGAGHAADRPRRVLPHDHRLAQPARGHGAVRARQAAGRRVPVRRVPRLGRGVPRGADPVHAHPLRHRAAASGPGAATRPRPPPRPGRRRAGPPTPTGRPGPRLRRR